MLKSLLLVFLLIGCDALPIQSKMGKFIQKTPFAHFGSELPTLAEFKETHGSHDQLNYLKDLSHSEAELLRKMPPNDYSCHCLLLGTDGMGNIEVMLSMGTHGGRPVYNVLLSYENRKYPKVWVDSHKEKFSNLFGRPVDDVRRSDGSEVKKWEFPNGAQYVIQFKNDDKQVFHMLYPK
jgi:hypothetical protein